MSETISIRQASEDDLVGIAMVAACPEAPHWPMERYTEILNPGPATTRRRILLVAEDNGLVLGFAVGALVNEEAELESVAVLPEFRRQGIGRELCETVLEWARSHNVEEIWLEVRASSEGAQALYRALGFASTGTRRNYYVDPLEDAVLMSAHLGKPGHIE